MMREMKKVRRIGSRLIVALLVFCMAFSMSMVVMAEDDNNVGTTAVGSDPRDSILQLWMAYEDDGGDKEFYQGGTCFLINDEYVLTNKHLYDLDNIYKDTQGNTEKDEHGNEKTIRTKIQEVERLTEPLKDNDPHVKLFLMVNKDMMVEATVHDSAQSKDMDFAAVKLSEKIYDRSPIALGDSDAIEAKDKVYALGYPKDSFSTKNYNTKEDVSIVDGIISKVTVTGSVDIIEHTAPLNEGNSGGPLLNENNEVIGINAFIQETKNYSIQINPLRKALDTFGIPYTTGTSGATVPANGTTGDDGEAEEPEKEDNSALISELQSELSSAKAVDTKGYTEDSVAILDDSIGAAENVLKNTDAKAAQIQSAIDDLKASVTNLEEKEGMNMMLVGGIAAAVIVVIVIIVLVIVLSGKKKKEEEARRRMQQTQSGGPAGPVPFSQSVAGPTSASRGSQTTVPQPEGAGETTLLNAGAGETTLLSGAGNAAYLIRKKNGEKIVINSQNFAIGKERMKVNYCISDNTSVSRCHAVITKKGSDYYVTDQGSTNFTFVNDVQISPKKETLLADKSVLKLSDEEFEFYLS